MRIMQHATLGRGAGLALLAGVLVDQDPKLYMVAVPGEALLARASGEGSTSNQAPGAAHVLLPDIRALEKILPSQRRVCPKLRFPICRNDRPWPEKKAEKTERSIVRQMKSQTGR